MVQVNAEGAGANAPAKHENGAKNESSRRAAKRVAFDNALKAQASSGGNSAAPADRPDGDTGAAQRGGGKTGGKSGSVTNNPTESANRGSANGSSAPPDGGDGFAPVAVESGPNDFSVRVDGPNPDMAVGGTQEQQEDQRDKALQFLGKAARSYVSSHTPIARTPSDAQMASELAGLSRNPPKGEDGGQVSHAIYESNIPNATPKQAYEHFVNQPNEVFNAGGMEIRPAGGQLQDGGRYTLEIGGPTPTWLPVEMSLDPKNNQAIIHTLDGHMLRGEQTFTFSDNGDGGTKLTQDAHFQASSALPGELQELTSIATGQHDAWQYAHREMYEQFNGGRGYAGMGIEPLNAQQKTAWRELAGNVVNDPGGALDTVIDSAGVLANAGIDYAGRRADDALGVVGAPGGDAVREGADAVGDSQEDALDRKGDAVEDAVETAGRFANQARAELEDLFG